MKNSALGLAMLAFAAAAPTVALAQDQWYKFDYTNSLTGQHAYGSLDVAANTAVDGFIYVDSGPVTGFWPLIQGGGTSPLGLFNFDNAIDPTNPSYPLMTTNGLLFGDSTQEVNIWLNPTGVFAPGDYSLWGGTVAGYQPQDNGGNFTMSIAPAPGSLALLGLGGLVSLRRRRS